MTNRAKLDLIRRGRVLDVAGEHPDGRTVYLVELDAGGQVQGPGPEGLDRGARITLRRYQVAAPPGSHIRGTIPWLAVDPEDADPALPPDSLGKSA